MRTILQDLRYAVRQLIKLPGFTFTAVISLALGIGATTAVFSVVYAIIMDPYPYAAPDRMIHMRFIQPNGGTARVRRHRNANGSSLRKSPVVEDTFLEDDWNLTVTGSDLPEDVSGVYLTSNAFQLLRRSPRAGPWTAALRRHRRPGPAARRRSELQVLAAPLQLRPRHPRQNHPAGPQELPRRRRRGFSASPGATAMSTSP